ncbi:hypothetical protein AML91_07545 [Paenibacillus jilunlii]|uniref:Uncharacterized protein n=1 Tax=Paenibacillus jilunlii TaxID=682956 RepID=A0ABR5T1T6_9BACL|nr:hypothetical protein AML91_07545 [Paenibacillus jilunlii]
MTCFLLIWRVIKKITKTMVIIIVITFQKELSKPMCTAFCKKFDAEDWTQAVVLGIRMKLVN